MSEGKWYKLTLLVLAVALLIEVGFSQQLLNRARTRLGLTRTDPLENAPPVLAFTTVALGGFRGLIANALWVRAMDMQDEGKYFEMVQLADWITTLQPHIVTVWVVQAWNMAYNISIKFQDPHDRWMWVLRGIELLRDQGLKYNPHETLMYRELAWFFQHKMGQNLDDAQMYYKQVWAREMTKVLGGGRPNYAELLNPQTDEARSRLKTLREKYKMEPRVMKDVDDHYGPLDWRLPESHAIYWAWLGLERAKPEELITLRRVIYQSMQLAFQRGHLLADQTGLRLMTGPNLDIISHVNQSYEDMMKEDPKEADQIKTGHRNFLRDAVYFLYEHNRMAQARRWFDYIRQKYPEKPLLDGKAESLPGTVSLDEYALGRVEEDVSETSQDRTMAALEGLLVNYYNRLALGGEISDDARNYELMARKVYQRYEKKIEGQQKRIGLEPFAQIEQRVLRERLNSDIPDELKAQLRTVLGLPAPAPSTNPPPAGTTNALGRP